MKSLFGRCLLCIALAGFLPACTGVYTDTATEKEFCKVLSGDALVRERVSAATAEYQVSGFDYTVLQITAKRDDKLKLRYSGGKRTPVELRMNGETGALFNAKNMSFTPFASGDAAVVSLVIFQKLFWHGPECIAEHITLANSTPEKLDGTGPLCRQFLLTLKKKFALYMQNVRVFTDAETHAVHRISYDLIVEKTVHPVAVDFMDCAWHPGKDMFPRKAGISFQHSNMNFVLKSSDRNVSVSDDLFRLSGDEHKQTEQSDNLK